MKWVLIYIVGFAAIWASSCFLKTCLCPTLGTPALKFAVFITLYLHVVVGILALLNCILKKFDK